MGKCPEIYFLRGGRENVRGALFGGFLEEYFSSD